LLVDVLVMGSPCPLDAVATLRSLDGALPRARIIPVKSTVY